MTSAPDLFANDQAKRDECGPGWEGCFIAPELPEPVTSAEKAAREVLDEYPHREFGRSVTVHIYDVLDLLERAYLKGREVG